MTEADFGKWQIGWIAEDGARISILKYAGNDLLTQVIPSFRKPQNNYGEYELKSETGVLFSCICLFN